MFNLQHLIKRDLKKLAANITQEQGKTLPDAEGDVSRGLQVFESISEANKNGPILGGRTRLFGAFSHAR